MTMKTLAVLTIVLALTPIPCAHATTLTIPTLQLQEKITANLNAGPAWWPTTGRPGQGDTIAIAGHRTTHTHPFHNLDRLRKGDLVYVRSKTHTYRYAVSSRRIMSARNLHIADSVGHERILLTACSRRDGTPTSAAYRIVVYALPMP